MDHSDQRGDFFRSLLENEGERAALEYLSSLSAFRFVAVIYFVDGRGHPVHYFDRQNPDVRQGEELDQRATYCNTVIATREPFETPNAIEDLRLVEHAARQHVSSYVGVPILAEDGSVRAVLCHFDIFPRSTADVDHALLQQAAAALQPRLRDYQLPQPASAVSREHVETIGNRTLYVYQRTRPDWPTPRYTIERTKTLPNGSLSHRICYGRDGFASLEEAVDFGREWCQL